MKNVIKNKTGMYGRLQCNAYVGLLVHCIDRNLYLGCFHRQIEGSTETYAEINIEVEAGMSAGIALNDLHTLFLGSYLLKYL